MLDLKTRTVQAMIQRGELPAERDERNRYALRRADVEALRERLERENATRTGPGRSHKQDADELRRQNEYLREQLDTRTDELREHRRLLAGALERIPPKLEAPQESPPDAPESPVTPDEQQGRRRAPRAGESSTASPILVEVV